MSPLVGPAAEWKGMWQGAVALVVAVAVVAVAAVVAAVATAAAVVAATLVVVAVAVGAGPWAERGQGSTQS